MSERRLTPEAQNDRDEFDSKFEDRSCSCHINPPCSYCTHPGNPSNQEEDEFAWLPEAETMPAIAKPAINIIPWAPGMEIKEGIYSGMPEDVYFATFAISNSGLKEFDIAPDRYKRGEREQKKAQALGKLWHTGLLEPNDLLKRFMPTDVERFDERTAVYKEAAIKANCRKLIKQPEWDEMERMRGEVRSQGGALISCLDHPGLQVELSFFWWDYPSRVFCRARADIAILEHGVLGDVKTCNKAGEDFKLSVRDWLYHWQASFYTRGMRKLGIEIAEFPFFAIEKRMPYLYASWYMPRNALDHADKEITRLLMEYRECLDANKWPGYPQEIRTIEYPDSWLRIYG